MFGKAADGLPRDNETPGLNVFPTESGDSVGLHRRSPQLWNFCATFAQPPLITRCFPQFSVRCPDTLMRGYPVANVERLCRFITRFSMLSPCFGHALAMLLHARTV
jgi:hypothetical protein